MFQRRREYRRAGDCSSEMEDTIMKLAKIAQKLVPPTKQSKHSEKTVAKKKGNILTDPEETPQEPKNRVNRRDQARQQTVANQHNMGRNDSSKR
jgi:hypothetical protein